MTTDLKIARRKLSMQELAGEWAIKSRPLRTETINFVDHEIHLPILAQISEIDSLPTQRGIA